MRIAIIGTSGSGKTTLGRRLAAGIGAPFVEMDAINWQAGWRSLSAEDPAEFTARVEAALAGPAWVIDGNYSAARAVVWARATHLVWLDYDRPTIMARVIRRSIARALSRRPLWADNREDWRRWGRPSHPIRWAWDTWARRRADAEAHLADPAHAHLQVIRLRRPGEAAGVLARLAPASPA